MRERFLHFIWQYQYFDKSVLQTTQGEPINILHPGHGNTHAGPDFQNAKIQVNGMEWNGHVEIHVRSLEWQKHGHAGDAAYANVVLHVVWEDDMPVRYADGQQIPTLVLNGRVSKELLQKGESLLENRQPIPCSSHWPQVNPMTKLSMLERAVMDRLEQKTSDIRLLLTANGMDWEETTYQWLAKNMGFKVNSDPFFSLAQRLPCKIVRKHADNPQQVEAMLFGMAGMLEASAGDDYYQSLKAEYTFLAHKYGLEHKHLQAVEWRFLRLRPANFPTIRLAQFAALLTKHGHLFSFLTAYDRPEVLLQNLAVAQSDYWQSHYRFGVPSKRKIAGLGRSSIENIIINTAVPLLAAYGKISDSPEHVDKAVELLAHVKAEKNHVTDLWSELGQKIDSAFDSQGYLSLYRLYCQPHRCLQCAIGVSIMKQ